MDNKEELISAELQESNFDKTCPELMMILLLMISA